jgi:uracil-DNA glycosylase
MEYLPEDWMAVLAREFEKAYFIELQRFVAGERALGPVYPDAGDVFAAFRATPFDAVRVVVIGQDPYHGEGEAHGLCFSVRPGVRKPPSLDNIFKELKADVGCDVPEDGCLNAWAMRGTLLLNTTLTVRANEANAHRGHGWETFTAAVVDALNRRARPMVFLLWGAHAKKFARGINLDRHGIIEGVHPSPLSAHRGFFGSRPFSGVNKELIRLGEQPMDWSLVDSAIV